MTQRLTAWWHLSRPRMLPYVLMLVLAGYGWAHWDRALAAQRPDRLVLVLLAWSLLLGVWVFMGWELGPAGGLSYPG